MERKSINILMHHHAQLTVTCQASGSEGGLVDFIQHATVTACSEDWSGVFLSRRRWTAK